MRGRWAAVGIIVAAGAVLRLAYLDHPPIWGDEAMTFGRACGTFQQMIAAMDRWAFVPLHYALIWLLGQFWTLTPGVLRAGPTVAGILTVPAIYWLGCELAGKRAAIVMAILAASSAYLLNYSRDAKMYSEFWLFCVLSAAALLWWLRARHAAAWWTWVAASTAMVGLQTQGAMLLAIELLVVLTSRHGNWSSVWRLIVLLAWMPFAVLFELVLRPIAKVLRWFGREPWRWMWARSGPECVVRSVMARFAWPPVVLFLAGLCVILPGPLCYYAYANHYATNVEQNGWMRTGLSWVYEYNDGRKPIELPAYAATAYVTGWELPKFSEMNQIELRTRRLLIGSCVAIGALLALGLFPWRSRRRWRWKKEDDDRPLLWRPLLWVSMWLVLPAYGTFVLSLPRGVMPAQRLCRPRDWIAMAAAPVAGHWRWVGPVAALAAIGLALAAAPTWRKSLMGLVRVLFLVAVVLSICELMAWARVPLDVWAHKHLGESWDEHSSLWMPRYFAISLPAVIATMALLIRRLPSKPLRIAALAVIVITNVAQHGARVFAGSEPPTELIARDVLASQGTATSTRAYVRLDPRRVSFGAPGSGLLKSTPMAYYLAIYSGRKTTPDHFVFGLERTFDEWPPAWRADLAPYIVKNIAASPRLKRVIVWDELTAEQIDQSDKLAEALGGGWKRISEQQFPVRDHWTWRDLYVCRRREYDIIPGFVAPAPPPAPSVQTTRPATRPAAPRFGGIHSVASASTAPATRAAPRETSAPATTRPTRMPLR